MKIFSESDCLRLDPFDGDIGESNDRILRDKIVKARKKHDCYWCNSQINIGELSRVLVAKFDGIIMSYRWCGDCCCAMANDSANDTNLCEERLKAHN